MRPRSPVSTSLGLHSATRGGGWESNPPEASQPLTGFEDPFGAFSLSFGFSRCRENGPYLWGFWATDPQLVFASSSVVSQRLTDT